MRGLMMDFPLTLATILERSGKYFAKVEIVSRRPNHSLHRTTYGDVYRRARRLAESLQRAGLRRGDRVATLMWNHSSHLEAFLGIPVTGGVLHPLNWRLHANEIAKIANHAGDRFLIVDDVLVPLYESFGPQVGFERVWVNSFGGCATGYETYEGLLDSAAGEFRYPPLEETDAAALCFTSGTTGNAKGVLYSHRAIVLHSFAQGQSDTFGLGHSESALLVAPMFHANGWGFPYTAAMAGAKLVLPGPHLDPESVLDLIQGEGVSVAGGVPTVWIGALAALEQNPGRWKFSRPVRIAAGGSAPPESVVRGLDRHGLHIMHLWGMTETTPLATACQLKSYMEQWPEERRMEVRLKQGRPAPFVELRVMTAEGEAPWDGQTVGELETRGPWVAASYYNAPEAADRWTADGWFRTGDVASIDAEGYVKIVDRSKDLIKSGGEWISSVDLENALMSHPAVREAAVIGVPHPKWQERPLAVVVLKDGIQATPKELRSFLSSRFAKWQLPDAFVFAAEIPRTSVGKFLKSKLREQYRNWQWDS